MPIGDVLYNADISRKPDNIDYECSCRPKPPHRPEPMWFVPPPVPFPIPANYPHFDPYRRDDEDKDDSEKE